MKKGSLIYFLRFKGIKDQEGFSSYVSLSTFKLGSQENQGPGHLVFLIMYFSKFSQFENFFYSF